MKKGFVIIIVLMFVFVSSVVRAEGFDPEAISQVSKGIAEWKLMNQDKSETQAEHGVYVSSALSGMVERGSGKDAGIIIGLAAFDNDYEIESQIRQWELNTGEYYSSKNASLLNDPYSVIRTVRNTAIKTELGMGIKMTKLAPIWTPISTIHTAGDTFYKTVDRVGKSMQIMNPPIYLQNNPNLGQFAMFTPSSERFLSIIPVSGTREGWGSYPVRSGYVNYKETLSTQGPIITRTHTDWATSNAGTYYRYTEIKVPATNSFERFMMTRYPTGSYWDPNSSMTTTTIKMQSHRIETSGGITKVTPLPTTNWSIPNTNWNVSKTNWNIPKTTSMPGITNYPPPDKLFSIKNPLDAYKPPPMPKLPTYTTPSMPKMPAYTPPRMPSSSTGRKY